jgi:enoyl-CoA hydratase
MQHLVCPSCATASFRVAAERNDCRGWWGLWSLDMMLTGRSIDAQTAMQIGLVSRVVAKERLVEETMSIASTIANLSPFVVKAAKSAAMRSFRRDLDADIEDERALFALCLAAKAERS